MSNIFSMDKKDFANAVVSAVVSSLIAFIGSSTNVFTLDWKQGLAVVLTSVLTSVLKSLTTTKEGDFAGIVKIK